MENHIGEWSISTYLYGLYQGDCDSDVNCEPGLHCFQPTGQQKVLGCSGHEDATDMFGKDICITAGSIPSPVDIYL